MRIALDGGETPSGAAALQALLAFASVHRHGLEPHTVELKIAALSSLVKGFAAPGLTSEEAIRHIVTGMLLCSFEAHHQACDSNEWARYLGGVKTVLKACSTKQLLQLRPEVTVLLDWVYYHDVLARFSLVHCKRGGVPEILLTPTDIFYSQVRA